MGQMLQNSNSAPSRAHLAMAADPLDCHNVGSSVRLASSGQRPGRCWTASTTQNSLGPILPRLRKPNPEMFLKVGSQGESSHSVREDFKDKVRLGLNLKLWKILHLKGIFCLT